MIFFVLLLDCLESECQRVLLKDGHLFGLEALFLFGLLTCLAFSLFLRLHFSGNYAYQGGAALNNLGIATVKDTEIIDNHAVLGAGAIDSDGGVSLELVKGTVVGNSGTLGTIRSGGELTVVESIVTDNTAAVGGGIFAGGSITISQTMVARNTATFGEGGGIYFAGGGGEEKVISLSDSRSGRLTAISQSCQSARR